MPLKDSDMIDQFILQAKKFLFGSKNSPGNPGAAYEKGPRSKKWRNLLQVAQSKWELNSKSMEVVKKEMALFFSMISDAARGRHKIPQKTLVTVIAAMLYFITPIDLIPDFLVGMGFLDDVAVIRYVYKKIREDMEVYKSTIILDKDQVS